MEDSAKAGEVGESEEFGDFGCLDLVITLG
jgi:hypothetical protein